MSEPITEMDIRNWREYYSEIPEYEMLGRDFFTISCMDTIDALRAELEQVASAGLRDTKLALSLNDKVQQLRAELDRERAELERAREETARLRERAAELESRLDLGGNLGDITPFPELALRVENKRLRSELKQARELYQGCIELCREAERYVNYPEPSFMDFVFIVRQWATENRAALAGKDGKK